MRDDGVIYNNDVFITAQEAARILLYKKPDMVYLLCRKGVLKATKRGTKWLIDRESFMQYCKALTGQVYIPSQR